MTRILVTGGRTGLGREVVDRLRRADHQVRVLSRKPRPVEVDATVAARKLLADAPPAPPLEWAQVDLGNGQGLAAALKGVDVVIHAASSPMQRPKAIDSDGTRFFLEAAAAAVVQHFVYVSIVGVHRIPINYYRQKLAAEEHVRRSGVPFTILRSTQFHSFLLRPLELLGPAPVRFVPKGFQFQPIDPREVADLVVELVGSGPAGPLPDIGGPAVRSAEELARAWGRDSRSPRPCSPDSTSWGGGPSLPRGPQYLPRPHGRAGDLGGVRPADCLRRASQGRKIPARPRRFAHSVVVWRAPRARGGTYRFAAGLDAERA